MKIVPITTDSRHGFRLSDAPAAPPSPPGQEVSITSTLQVPTPVCFARLRVGADDRYRALWPEEQSERVVGDWRIDEIKIDDVPALVGADYLGIGRCAFVRATNIGDRSSYFYATWEVEELH